MSENENGQEKTEQPTGKRRQESIDEGNIARSDEISKVAIFFAFLLVLSFYGGSLKDQLTDVFKVFFLGAATFKISPSSFDELLGMIIIPLLKLFAPIFLFILIVGIGANLMQSGINFSWKALRVDFGRLNPIHGLKNKFSIKSLVDLAKDSLKIIVIFYIAYITVKDQVEYFSSLTQLTIFEVTTFFGELVLTLMFRVGLFSLFLALADYGYTRYKWEKDLMMTKQEVKDEMKNQEGDMRSKGVRKQRGRELVLSRMLDNVPTADVVVSNPTHYSVALKYVKGEMHAPKVVAKGKGYVALKIREIAEKNSIPRVENVILARSLYKFVKIGKEIPEQFYSAVAEVLAYVYKLNRKRKYK